MKNGVSLSNRFLFNPQRVGLRASRLLASLRAGIFPSSSSISGDTTFFFASRQVSLSLTLSLFLFLSWSLSSKESSVVNGVFEELFVAIGQQDNSSPISIQIISHTMQLPVTRDKFTSFQRWIITESIQYSRFSHSYSTLDHPSSWMISDFHASTISSPLAL